MKRVLINGILVVLAVLSTVGCRRNEEIDQPSDGVLRIMPGVFSSRPASEVAATRAQVETASKSLFKDGDQISVYVTRSEDSLSLAANVMREFDYSNLLYTRAGGAFATTAGTPAGTIYYPYKGVNVDLWGVFPYDADAKTKSAEKYPLAVQVEQNSEAAILASDFMVSRVKGVSPSQSTAVPMEFLHRTSRIYLRLQVPTEIDGKPIKMDDPIAKAYFDGMKSEGLHNFNADLFGADPAATAVSMSPLARGSEEVDKDDLTQGVYLYYELLAVPQTVTAGINFLRLIVNYQSGAQGLFMMELQADVVLLQGKQHVFEVSFDNNQRLRLDGTKILDWDEVSNVNSDLEEVETVRIGDVDWAVGNLVANGATGCRIGEPGDGGLYFPFGSLIGYAGGADGSGVGVCTKADGQFWGGAAFDYSQDVRVTPSTYNPAHKNWPKHNGLSSGAFGYYYYFDFGAKYDNLRSDVNRWRDPAHGIGDPCEYYLGSPWRLPTYDELSAITGSDNEGSFVSWTDAAITGRSDLKGPQSSVGAWFGPNSKTGATSTPTIETDLFFPASGCRKYDTGSYFGIGLGGFVRSSSFYSTTESMHMAYHKDDGVSPRAYQAREYAYSVRCVKTAVVTDYPDHIVINDLKWKTKNIGASSSQDYGSYINWEASKTACPSTWRLPTQAEIEALITSGHNWATLNGVNGRWFGPGASSANLSTAIFMPAAGCRFEGEMSTVGSYGYCWSSNTYDANRTYHLNFSNSAVNVSPGPKTTDFTVRCVQDVPLEPVVIDGLKWATGNLVADGANGCKIGKPQDGGLYFQFGSLIGWKGGASGDGTGRPIKANGVFYGGPSFNASNEVQVYPTTFTKLSDIGTVWPSQQGINLYYFGNSAAPYATAGTNIQDFAGFTAGTLAVDGIGDPCAYYLGSPWRLPTYLETKSMYDAATSKTYPGSWTNGTSTDSYFVCTFAGGIELKFPASGNRFDSSGAVYSVGSEGCFWSSSVKSLTMGYSLGFVKDNSDPQYDNVRRLGCPVRCVSK